MKRQALIFAFLVATTIHAFSQITFENGYLITDEGERIECLIKNIDWRSNPTQFEYKMSADAPPQKASISTVLEFGINDDSKYVRAIVQIDRSPSDIQNMSFKRQPLFLTEHLFLKVLIEGTATLYQYTDGNLVRYFYNVKDSETRQ